MRTPAFGPAQQKPDEECRLINRSSLLAFTGSIGEGKITMKNARIVIFALVGLFFSLPALSAQQTEWYPGSSYDPKIPTPESVLGYKIGDDFTEHLRMIDYMKRLEGASQRVKVFKIGQSNERREMILVVISAPENIGRLEEIRKTVAELTDPRVTSESRARDIAATTPAVAWMNFANDGNESAAFEAAIELAYQLAAGQDADTMKILKEVITVIDPAHNPESHSRYVAWMKASATGNPDPSAQEHRRDWRMDNNNNHYQIDLNRDAAFLSQVESRTVVAQIHHWNPVVFVDHHGNPDRFFFPPWAIPVNSQLPPSARKWVKRYGKQIAAAFDRHGWTYFTHDVYDLHYPGYYDSYPALNGATGMTFETDGGGNKGLAYRLPDGRIATLRDGILHHFTGSMATLLTTAQNRRDRLMDFYEFRASAMRDVGREKVKQFVLIPGQDPGRAADLVELLLRHDIEVQRAGQGFRSQLAHDYYSGTPEARAFPAGSFLIRANQPQKRLLRTLLDPETPLEEDFLQQARDAHGYNSSVGRKAPKKPLGFYDINAWSLPLAYGVEAYWTEDVVPASAEPVTARPVTSLAAPRRARFAYLFPWNSRGSTRLVARLMQEGFQVSLDREAFTLDGHRFPAGTVVLRQQVNPASLHERVVALAGQEQVSVWAADTAMVEEGRDLGDRHTVVDLEKPSIAVICEEPTSPTAFGAVWFLLEQVYRVPFTAIKAADLESTDLRPYNVIVLPDGSSSGYDRVFGASAQARLKNWVREGGSLVCIKGAAQWASQERVGLTTARWRQSVPVKQGKSDAERPLDLVPGAFVKVDLDLRHYLAMGMGKSVIGLIRSRGVFDPSEQGARVGTLDAEQPVVSGFVFDESREALRAAPFLWDEPTGRGHVICFADDVTFRTFLHDAQRLFLNAILLAPSGRW